MARRKYDDEEGLARAIEERAQRMHTQIEEHVRQGALSTYTSEALKEAKRLWESEPALRAKPAQATLREKPESHYTNMPGDRRKVGWVVPYDSAERLICGAASSHQRPSEELHRNHAMHLVATHRGGLEVYGQWPRRGEAASEEAREAVEAVRRIERTMAPAPNGER